ncbi:MAG: 2-oxoglutarate dehydrogenase E1 component, partial [Pseudomonadota bacterium]
MTDQSPNDIFHSSSFLQGHNQEYVEQLHANYAKDPASVDESWQEFFAALGEETEAAKAAAGPSWARSDWPPAPGGDLLHALDYQWDEPSAADVAKKVGKKAKEAGVSISDDQMKQAVTDSMRALMLIRAYRIRGHLAAKLDPLNLKEPEEHPELDPASYGFTAADMDRPIFLDNVLGLQTANMRQIVEIVKRTYCGTFALQ